MQLVHSAAQTAAPSDTRNQWALAGNAAYSPTHPADEVLFHKHEKGRQGYLLREVFVTDVSNAI